MTPLGLCIVPTLFGSDGALFARSIRRRRRCKLMSKSRCRGTNGYHDQFGGQGSTSSIPILVPIKEAARLLGIGKTRTYELANAGALEARKLGNLTMITMDSIRRFVDGLPSR